MTTYRDIYNAETRAFMSRLMDWHIQAAQRFGPRGTASRDDLDNAIEACHDIFREWARTHETRP